MQVVIHESSGESVRAGYECPCGCRPSVLYERAGTPVQAPWGDPLTAAWLIGPSVHADESPGHHHDEAEEHSRSQGADEHATTQLDPVCGMSVVAAEATTKGLSSTYNEHDYYFCGRGCKLEFDEDPNRYLDPAYVPSM